MLLLTATAFSQTVKHAVCDDRGTIRIIYADGKSEHVLPQPHQVACGRVTIATDGQAVGWSVLKTNCCTSYPIATAVAVLTHGRKRVFPAGQMVWDWRFIDKARKLAILSGPVHGNASIATLHDLSTGRIVATWNGNSEPPSWAAGWQQQFAINSH